jgi:hypothetical protein
VEALPFSTFWTDMRLVARGIRLDHHGLPLNGAQQVSLLVEASLLLGQSVLCVPLLAIVLWSTPDVTVERVEKEKTTEGSLEFGNHLPSEETSVKAEEEVAQDEKAEVPAVAKSA